MACCTIGTTMTIGDFVVPALVGVDIGCGMETVVLREKSIDFQRLDAVIREGMRAESSQLFCRANSDKS